MSDLTKQFWTLTVVNVIFGVMIAMMDTSPNWDDTGITVSAILFITFITGLIRSDFAWLWALIIGGCVFGFNMAYTGKYDSAAVFVFAFLGSYSAALVKRMFGKLD